LFPDVHPYFQTKFCAYLKIANSSTQPVANSWHNLTIPWPQQSMLRPRSAKPLLKQESCSLKKKKKNEKWPKDLLAQPSSQTLTDLNRDKWFTGSLHSQPDQAAVQERWCLSKCCMKHCMLKPTTSLCFDKMATTVHQARVHQHYQQCNHP
jgi:hypothetical protein